MAAATLPHPPDLADVVRASRGDPAAIPGLVRGLVEEHGRWNSACINLVASHNHMSPTAQALLASSVADNILSGHLGARSHSGGAWIEAIDTLVVELCKRIFGAASVEYRPMSGALANGVVLCSLTRPGETIMAMPAKYGGHHTYRENGYAGILGLNVEDIPYDERAEEIDLAHAASTARRARPKLIIVGSAEPLFPYPVGQLREIADSVGARLFYDGAHILGLAAGGQFQDPLREGAHILTGSGQKTLGGPIGGLVMASDEATGERISSVTSGLISNYHNNRIAALAVTLAEQVAFGRDFAAQIVRNAQVLARSLDRQGVPVLGGDRGYTTSHVVQVDATLLPSGQEAFGLLEKAHILSSRGALPHTYPERRGIRLGTPAMTRLGMKEEQMEEVAVLVRRVVVDLEPPSHVARDASKLASGFATVHYAFRDQRGPAR